MGSRITVVAIIIFGTVAIFLLRLFSLQVINGNQFMEAASAQYSSSAQETFDRGSIFFTEKNNELLTAATTKPVYNISINTKLLVSPEAAYANLSKITSIDKNDFFEKANKKDDPYELIAKNVDENTAKKIQALAIAGVDIAKDKTRNYPAGTMAAHILGFVSQSKSDGTAYSGRYGLEKYYDSVLSRKYSDPYANFFANTISNVNKSISGEDSSFGEGDVVLSIEPTVQGTLESELQVVCDKWTADLAGGIIIEPSTGRIVAMAATPAFDPNEFGKVKDLSVFMNPNVENVFEMGSIMKPLTMAAALDAGVLTASTTYYDKGYLDLNGKHIANYDGKGRGTVSMQEVLNQSLNTGAVFAMEQLGMEEFSKRMLAYGLGEKTGIDLPNEIPGLVQNLQSSREIEHATASYGQGLAVTPIEMTRALAALANGGVLMRPYVADRLDYTVGIQKATAPVAQRRVLKEATSREITRMLTVVVDNALVNGKYKNPNYTVAAKTGTAYMAKENGGGYYDDRFLHSFFGYFPAQNARFLVFLYLKNPHNVQYASGTLTEPFMNLMNFLVNYYEIPPDRDLNKQT
jgi:cell division protein FtsI/penicillin-binding protein 2